MKSFIKLIIFLIVLFITIFLLNTYFGWYGYEQWKHRRDTYGNKRESIKRKVFIKNLNYKSTHSLVGFNVYLERGYWFGFHDMNETRYKSTMYPYQVSFNGIGKDKFLSISNLNEFDSISNESFERPNIYLDKKILEDTVILKIMDYKTRDSIGFIKIWDKDALYGQPHFLK